MWGQWGRGLTIKSWLCLLPPMLTRVLWLLQLTLWGPFVSSWNYDYDSTFSVFGLSSTYFFTKQTFSLIYAMFIENNLIYENMYLKICLVHTLYFWYIECGPNYIFFYQKYRVWTKHIFIYPHSILSFESQPIIFFYFPLFCFSKIVENFFHMCVCVFFFFFFRVEFWTNLIKGNDFLLCGMKILWSCWQIVGENICLWFFHWLEKKK